MDLELLGNGGSLSHWVAELAGDGSRSKEELTTDQANTEVNRRKTKKHQFQMTLLRL
jgi:hypothetical protein